jgi:nucleoside-diphosphate-sugar epimerase
MCEALLNDLNRRRLLDGFALRFPTIAVRAGRPTQAASSFLSGMIREPMNGEECVIPIEDREYRSVLCSPKILVQNLVTMIHVPNDVLPPHMRAINFPGISATIQELMDALSVVGGKDKLLLIKEKSEPGFERILRSWPREVDCSTALKLGLSQDDSAESIIKHYVEYINGTRKN